ncbi:hypothetical protein HU200_012637 [Digitaria exilis]|uniref:Uncharacterized protein n=1 Tax=Digitaria exilis TaxID=1010633 RepID=A0A835FEN3_9POAL|nr:hypothetical protein HU200_012637 [Digitaria exilis]
MEGGRSPIALLFLALALAAASRLAAVAQLDQPAGQRYMLIAVKGNGDSRSRLAFRTDPVAIPGLASKTNHWFAVTGSESLVPPGYGYGGDVLAPGQFGLGTLLHVLANNGTR